MHLRAYTSVLKQSPCGRAIFKPYKVSCVRGQVRALRERSADAKDAQGPLPTRSQIASPIKDFLATGARFTKGAHYVWTDFVRPGDLVIDATCGNGFDTLWLSRAVGPSGAVIAVDIQAEAIDATRNLLNQSLTLDLGSNVKLVQSCHSEVVFSSIMKEIWQGQPSLVCFNLGYLPGADKGFITKPASTLAAIKLAIQCLKSGGVLSVMTYIAHAGGMAEHTAVMDLLQTLSGKEWTVISTQLVNRPTSPILTLATRH